MIPALHAVRGVTILRLFLILSAGAMAAPGAAVTRPDDPAARVFLWNEANAGLAAANDRPGFSRAAESYQELVDAGARNGPVFYNMGVALLKAARYEAALDCFLRAERYLGRDPELLRNMSIARARQAKVEHVAEPWLRIVLFWHFGLKTSTRVAVAVAAFNVLWLAMALRAVRRGAAGLKTITAVALIVCAMFASSAATSAFREATARRIVFMPPPGPSTPAPAP